MFDEAGANGVGAILSRTSFATGMVEAVPNETGGLKMGSTYYYYVCYKFIRNYQERNSLFIYSTSWMMERKHYDASIPFTTSCPYLPGQPVNLSLGTS